MRLRTFTASTTADAMALVREHLGDDAVIVSTETFESGEVAVTAANEEIEASSAIDADRLGGIEEALAWHDVPAPLAERLLRLAASSGRDDQTLALADALAASFAFAPIGEGRDERKLMLVGPPGSGKTVSVAKLAARRVLAQRKTRVVTCDTVRAGGIEQLAAFTRLLDLPIHVAETAERLAELAEAEEEELVLIDTAGINPYDPGDRGELAELAAAASAEPVLVVPAGGDMVDTAAMAEIFVALGCRRLLVTRLDMARRLGSVLGAAALAELAFSEGSTTPSVATGLTPLTPLALARRLLPADGAFAAPRHHQPERAPS